MIILKHVGQNYIGDFQLLNKFKYILVIFVLNNAYSQTENYEEYLRFLPDSVRSSVESRISSDVDDNSNYETINNFQNNLKNSNQDELIKQSDFNYQLIESKVDSQK